MNGILTALLGASSGVGKGLQYQDELAMKRQQQRMERLGLAADLISKGITPPDELTADFGPSTPDTQPTPVQSAPQSAPQIPPSPPQGVLTQVLNRGPRMRDGFALPQQPQQAVQAPTATPTQPGGVSGMDILRSIGATGPTRVGGLSMDFTKSLPFRQAMLGAVAKQIETQYETDEGIRKALATGEIDKNKADALLAQRNATTPRLGDKDYAPLMGQVAGAQETAKLPADIQRMVAEGRISRENGQFLEQVRGSIQQQLQQNQQQFELGKLDKQQKFDRDQKAIDMAGQFANELGIQQWEATGQVMPNIVRSVTGQGQVPPTAPSTAVAPTPGAPHPTANVKLPALTPEQMRRANEEPSYKAFLVAKGYAFGVPQ